MAFRAHPYYLERDPAYRNSKPDPGAAFMDRASARRSPIWGSQGPSD